MKIGVTQALRCDSIHGRRGDDAAEGARCSETLVVRHDEQHVGRTLWRHDAWRPPRRRLRSLLLDHPAECRRGRWKLLTVDGGRRAGRTWDSRNLLSQCRDATEGQKADARKNALTDFHSGLPLRSCTWQKGRRVILSVAPLWQPRLTQIKFLAALMRQGRLKAKQPRDVELVYRNRVG